MEYKFRVGQEVKVIDKGHRRYGKTVVIKSIDEEDAIMPYFTTCYNWFEESDLEDANPRLKERAIYKYELKSGKNVVSIKKNAIITNVINQKNNVVMYALVSIYEEDVDINVNVEGTGWDVSYLGNLEDHVDVGTVGTHDGMLVWHVYAEKDDRIKFSKYL